MSGFLEIVDTTYIPGTGPLPAGPGQCDVGECAPGACQSYLLKLKKSVSIDIPKPKCYKTEALGTRTYTYEIPCSSYFGEGGYSEGGPATKIPGCEEKMVRMIWHERDFLFDFPLDGNLENREQMADGMMMETYGFGRRVNEDGTPNHKGEYWLIHNHDCWEAPKPKPPTPGKKCFKHTWLKCGSDPGSACEWVNEEVCIDIPLPPVLQLPESEIVYEELPSPQVQVCGLCPAPKVVTDYISSRYSTSTTIEDVITDLKDELTALLTEQGTLFVSIRSCGPIIDNTFFPPDGDPASDIKPVVSTYNWICGTTDDINPNSLQFEYQHILPLTTPFQIHSWNNFLNINGVTIDQIRLNNYIASTNAWLKQNWDTMDPSLQSAYLLGIVTSSETNSRIPQLYRVSSETKELRSVSLSTIDPNQSYTWIAMIPKETSVSNLLIEFNPATGQLEESIVPSNPYTNGGPRPEKYFVSYTPGQSVFLSTIDPNSFLELKNSTERAFSDVTSKPCCYSFKDYFGRQTNSCNYMAPSLCTIDGVTAFLASSSQASQSPLTVISAIPLADGTSCEDAACAGSFPQEIQGTCCIPGSSGWSCSVTTQSACYDAKGFWEAPKPDGLGGFNEANCTDRGVEHTNVDGSLKTVAYGPRNCAIHGDSVVDDTVTDKGACCSFQLASIVDNDLSVGATLHNNIIRKLYSAVDDPNYPVNGVYPIDVRFSMTNDGTSITLCFPYSSIIDKLYPLPDNYDPLRLEEAAAIMAQRNQRIVADFSVVPTSPTVSSWSVNVDRIEGNCIFLSIIKVS